MGTAPAHASNGRSPCCQRSHRCTPSARVAQLETDRTLSARLQEKIKAVLTKENVEANRLRLEVDVNDLQGYDAEVHRRYDLKPTGL